MAEVETINHKNHRSWFAWSGRIFLAVVITIMVTISHGSTAMALSNVGPSNPNDRYNMTLDKTHQYTTLEVPIYFKYNPGRVRVRVFDGRRWNEGAVFNGVWISGEGGTFEVSDFRHDELTGYWKGWVKARLGEGIKIYQFRLQLESPSDGIIAYGTGRASQADGRYNYDMRDNDGHYDKTIEMALPCRFTEPTHIGGPGSPYRLKLYDLDTWYPGWLNNNGMQPLSVGVYDESDGGRRVAYYDGNDPKYQCGQYNAGKDGVYGDHGCMGENGVLYVEMTMLPGHKYKLVIHNAWKNNLIEYELPFDNIFYNISCEPKIDMRAAVDYIDEAGRKRASAQGRYDSQNNSESRSDVFVFDQWGHNARTTWSSKGVSPDPAIILKEDAKVTPGKFLTWWFRAHNVSGYPPPDETDFANFRMTLNKNPSGFGWTPGGTSGWDEMTVWPPRRSTNWFQPSKKGGKLDRNNPQVTWGCSEWGVNCVDYHRQDWNKGVSFYESINYHYRYRVKAGDAGKALCQRVRNSWPVGHDWKERFTPWACAYVPYDYPPPPDDNPKKSSGIVPITKARQGKVQAGDTVTFDYRVENPTGPTRTRPFEYHNYTFILKRGASLPEDKEDRPAYYASWKGDGVSCKGGRSLGWRWNNNPSLSAINPCVGWDTGEKNVVLNVGESRTLSKSYGIYGGGGWLAQPGDKICSYIAVDNNWSVRNDQSADTFRASNIACAVVTKSPNLNLSGSDSYAKDGFTGSDVRENIVPGTDKRGSYSQYGLLTGDEGVVNFGSAGYTIASPANHYLACKLSYANTGNVKNDCKNLKGLQPAGLIKPDNGKLSTPKWPTSFKGKLASQVSIDSLPASGDYSRNSSLTITGGSLGKGQHVRLFVQGNVTISGNISVNEADPIHNSLSDIPSLTVVATGDIQVEHGVSVIAGTYVAGGKFESCKGAQKKKTSALGVNGVCQQKLKVNGAIVSGGSPVFRRTFGAGNEREDDQWDTKKISSTAEWINYTPNLWLTTSNGSSSSSLDNLKTTQVINLPVRY